MQAWRIEGDQTMKKQDEPQYDLFGFINPNAPKPEGTPIGYRVSWVSKCGQKVHVFYEERGHAELLARKNHGTVEPVYDK